MPGSDLDVMLLHAGRRDVGAIAERLWYPIWDEGLKLGHSVCTAREALTLADDDLDTATSLLSACATSPATRAHHRAGARARTGSGSSARSGGCSSCATGRAAPRSRPAKSRSCSSPT